MSLNKLPIIIIIWRQKKLIDLILIGEELITSSNFWKITRNTYKACLINNSRGNQALAMSLGVRNTGITGSLNIDNLFSRDIDWNRTLGSQNKDHSIRVIQELMELEAYHSLAVTIVRKEVAISQDQEANIDLNVLIF